MKKRMLKILAVLLITVFMAGSAWASQVTCTQVKIGQEWLQNGGTAPNVTLFDITYSASVALGTNNTIEVLPYQATLDELAVPNYYALIDAGGTQIAGTVDFRQDATSGNYTWIKLRFDADVPAGTNLFLVNWNGAGGAGPVNFIPGAGFSPNRCMQIQFTNAKDATGVPLSAPNTDAINIACQVQQFSAWIAPVTSVIDNADASGRTTFIPDGITTGQRASMARVGVRYRATNPGYGYTPNFIEQIKVDATQSAILRL